MPIYYDSTGEKITLTDLLGKGGEGSVYAIAGNHQTVGKIYHAPVSNEKAEKLRWMVGNQSPQLLKTAAWATETLHERGGGKMVGFLMPSVKAKEIHELYSPKSRRAHFPEADWRFLIHAAKNIARAFNSVHEAGHVIGDVNHGNCAVLPDGTVKLIDCDSYSIHANGKVYPCEVGISTHVPPELQKQSLRGATRLQAHDNFGLAVIIFQLLFLGRHPFAGRPLGQGEKSLEDNIREYRFAYGAGAASRQIQPPPGVPPLEIVSNPVANLFEKAFLTRDERPAPREWIEKLESLSSNLVGCGQNSGHHYLKTLGQCPWCEVERQTGVPVFSTGYRQPSGANGFNVVTIEQLLAAIQTPQSLPDAPTRQALTLPPDPELVKFTKNNSLFLTVLIVIEIALLIISLLIAGIAGGLIGGLAFAFIVYRLTRRTEPQLKKEVTAKYKETHQKWKKLEVEWKRRETNLNVLNGKTEIGRKIAEYKNLPILRQQKLKQLEEERYERQLEDYLDNFRILDANIKGIGWNRAVTLQSYGIETAADVNSRRVMSVSGFGPAYTQKLLMWRENLKSNFKFDPRKAVSAHDTQKVESEILNVRRQLESALHNEVTQLRVQTININNHNQYLAKTEKDLALDLAQAESNRNAVSGVSLGSTALFLLAIAVPLGGGLVELALAPSAPVAVNSITKSQTPPAPSPTIANISPAVNQANTAAVSANAANSSGNRNVSNLLEITNTDINSLTEIERQAKADDYYEQGIDLTRANNYAKAEKYYREAVRLDNTKPTYQHELGYALYRLKKYGDSAASLQKAMDLGSINGDTKKILGQDYIELKKWGDAQKVFTDITRSDNNSFSAYYNLGIAAGNAGNYQPAIAALKRAIQIEPNNTKAHFQLGHCYNQFGIPYLAEAEYQILSSQDADLAERLREEIEKLQN